MAQFSLISIVELSLEGKKFNRKIVRYGESLVDFYTIHSNNQCNDDKKKKDNLEARAGDRYYTICVKNSSISETLLCIGIHFLVEPEKKRMYYTCQYALIKEGTCIGTLCPHFDTKIGSVQHPHPSMHAGITTLVVNR